jgi:hypothetical protein
LPTADSAAMPRSARPTRISLLQTTERFARIA